MNFKHYCYTVLFYLLTPYLLIRLWWKGRSLPAYRLRLAERFCWGKIESCPVDIWVHAVSLGEVIAITPLIEQLLKQNKKILVTTMTPTGSQRVIEQFGARVVHRYLPYDYPHALRRFFAAFTPKLGIMVETELWPNLIHYACAAGVPLVLFNARLSAKSCKGYAKLLWLIRPLLNQFQGIYTQTETDAARFKSLGAEDEKVHVAGNIKFDLQIKQINLEPFLALKSNWGEERVIVIAASTHDDEEQQILTILPCLQEKISKLLLLIAPRHPERFATVHQLVMQRGFNTGLRSEPTTLNSQNEVVVLDSLGELLGFYHISDYAFVGGSLVPTGGHNILEPIAMKVPVFVGPYVHNFQTICQGLLEAEGMIQVHSAQELVDQLISLHHDEVRREKLSASATQVLHANEGALLRYLAITEEILKDESSG